MFKILTTEAPDLGRTMPAIDSLETITAAKHNACFYAFDTCDVWTADGWIVTAVATNGITHHLRKGTEVALTDIEPSTLFYFKHTPKSRHYMQDYPSVSTENEP